MTSRSRRYPLAVGIARAAVGIARAALLVFFGLPLLVLAGNAFRGRDEIFRYSTELSVWTFLPRKPTLDPLRYVLGEAVFRRQVVNTVVLGFSLATASAAVAFLTGFALARMVFPGRQALFAVILGSALVPLNVVVLPLYLVTRDLGLLDNFWGLLLPWVVSPLGIFLLRQAVADVPKELDEAAFMDGGGLWAAMRYAVLPNVRPALATTWLLSFVATWDAYLWPLVVTQDPDKQLLQTGLQSVASTLNQGEVRYDRLFAGCLVALIPAVLVFAGLQRAYRRGDAFTGLK